MIGIINYGLGNIQSFVNSYRMLGITSISLSVFVGVIAGVVPSYRAAGLDPIDALRYE